MPGVHAVFTGKDIAQHVKPLRVGGSSVLRPVKLYPLAVDKVALFRCSRWRWWWRTIATWREDAAEMISVDYDLLPVVIDPEAAMEPGANRFMKTPEAISSTNIISPRTASTKSFKTPTSSSKKEFAATASPLARSSRAPISASYNKEEDSLTMWSATANPHSLRGRIADILSFPEGKDPRDCAGRRRFLRR